MKVLSQSEKAMTLVQEGSYPESSIIRKELDYPVPLYLERMHIFYKKKKYKQYCDEYSKNHPKDKEVFSEKPILSTYTHPAVLSFLLKDFVAVGKVGSGTRVLAGVVLKELTKQVRKLSCDNAPNDCNSLKNFKLRNISASESLPIISLNTNKSDTDRISVGFGIAGAPYKTALNYLNNKNIDIGLMGIDPMLISELNIQYNLNLEATNFKGKYNKENDKIPTLATFCYLATKKNTDPYAIKAFLETLRDNRQDVYNAIGLYTEDSLKHFYKFYSISLIDKGSSNKKKTYLQFEKSDLISSVDNASTDNFVIKLNSDKTKQNKAIQFLSHPTNTIKLTCSNNTASCTSNSKEHTHTIEIQKAYSENCNINCIQKKSVEIIPTNDSLIKIKISDHLINTINSYSYEVNPNLDEFDFVDYYKPAFDKQQFIWRNIIFFILSTVPLFFLFSFFVTSIISTTKFDYYHNRVATIRKDNIPHNALLSIEYIGTSTLEELTGYSELERKVLEEEIRKNNIATIEVNKAHMSYITNIIRMLGNLIFYNYFTKKSESGHTIDKHIKDLENIEKKHKYEYAIKDTPIALSIFLVISSIVFYMNSIGIEEAPISWYFIIAFISLTLGLFVFSKFSSPSNKYFYTFLQCIYISPPLIVLTLFFWSGNKLAVLLILIPTLLYYGWLIYDRYVRFPKSYLKILKEHESLKALQDKQENTQTPNQVVNSYAFPLIREDQTSLIKKLIRGISDLFLIRREISTDFSTGGLRESDYSFVMDSIESLLAKLRKNLALRLYYLLVRNKDMSKVKKFISQFFEEETNKFKNIGEIQRLFGRPDDFEELLHVLFTARYLNKGDFDMLRGKYKFITKK